MEVISLKIPLHKQIEQDILKKIQSNEYEENKTIPTEIELSKTYNVSRPTIRQAIQSLVDEGYLEKRKKRGTIVKNSKIEQGFISQIESFNSEIYKKGMFPNTKVLTFTKIPASKEVSENLNVKEGYPVYKLIRLRFVKEKPVVFVTTFIPYDLLPEIGLVDFSKHSLYATFKEMGHPIHSVSRKLEIILADESVSYLLDVQENAPLFYFHTRGFTKNRTPIEYSIAKYRGDSNYFTFEISSPK